MSVATDTQTALEHTRGGAESREENLVTAITRAASDPNVDVAKMERLLDMKLRLVAMAAEASFNQAMARLQPKLPRIAKRGLIGRGTDRQIPYAKYEDICEAVLPLLWENGFTVSYSQQLTPSGNMMEIVATFRHIDGHKETGSAFTPLVDDSGGKNKVQGGGSVYSYGQRYAFSKFLNIVTEDEDDDGMQAASQPIDEKKVGHILDMIQDIKDNGQSFNDAGFLRLMRVDRIEQITNGDYDKAISALTQKRRKVS